MPPLRLDLACGDCPAEGFEGVDFFHPRARHKVNILWFPWPWADSSVDHIRCSHFVEHIPEVYVGPESYQAGSAPQYRTVPQTPEDRDLWCRFFDECWRILRPGGQMTVLTPHLQTRRAFRDPTHRRFLSPENFLYLNRQWRDVRGLSHYLGRCDFDTNAAELLVSPQHARPEDVHWNAALDMVIQLVARK